MYQAEVASDSFEPLNHGFLYNVSTQREWKPGEGYQATHRCHPFPREPEQSFSSECFWGPFPKGDIHRQ